MLALRGAGSVTVLTTGAGPASKSAVRRACASMLELTPPSPGGCLTGFSSPIDKPAEEALFLPPGSQDEEV